jgi:hypothetical protein
MTGISISIWARIASRWKLRSAIAMRLNRETPHPLPRQESRRDEEFAVREISNPFMNNQ